MEHLYKVYPRNPISDILPGSARIQEPTVLKLNRKEFLKCMANGVLYALVNNEEIMITDCNYDKAEALFDVPKIEISKESKQQFHSEIPTPEPIIEEEKEEEKVIEKSIVEEPSEPVIEEKEEETETVEPSIKTNNNYNQYSSKKKNKNKNRNRQQQYNNTKDLREQNNQSSSNQKEQESTYDDYVM